MRRWFERLAARRLAAVTFCDGCGGVCDAACRSRALRESTRDQALTFGVVR